MLLRYESCVLNYVAFYCEPCFLLPNIMLHIIYDLAYDLPYDTSVLGIEMSKWYAVYQGRVPGVYDECEDCLKQVNMLKGNNYKGYKSREEAEARYMNHLVEERKKNRKNTFIIVSMLLIVIVFLLYVILV